MPANPGINPSLTIAALAEYGMSQIPAKPDARQHPSPVAVSAPAARPR
jgi:cholesterol oxidase